MSQPASLLTNARSQAMIEFPRARAVKMRERDSLYGSVYPLGRGEREREFIYRCGLAADL